MGTNDRGGTVAMPRSVRLPEEFRYVHEPIGANDAGIPYIANRPYVNELKQRIVYSNGGALLITGYKGVGKSSLVKRAIEQVATENSDRFTLVHADIAAAQETSATELLFEIVRRLFESLAESGVLEELAAETVREIMVAYTRTSLAFKYTHSKASESGAEASLGSGSGILAKAKLGRKDSRASTVEASFLAYTTTDVEHDLRRIVDLLHAPPARASSRIFRFLAWAGLVRKPRPARIKLVVTLDELDKLTARPGGMEAMRALLGNLKNILTVRGVFFVFVGGVELHDEWVADRRKGDSLYESIFAWHSYVPCMWNGVDELLDTWIDEGATSTDGTALRDYLEFKARGTPRRLLQEVNELGRWDDGRASLDWTAEDDERIDLFAGLQKIVEALLKTRNIESFLPLPIDRDRMRLGIYFTIDAILRSANSIFTVEQLTTSTDVAVHATLRPDPSHIEPIVEDLVKHGLVERMDEDLRRATMVGDVAAAQHRRFRLDPDVKDKLNNVARKSEDERDGQRIPGQGIAVAPDVRLERELTDVLGNTVGRYQIRGPIEQGWVDLYRAFDRSIGSEVVIKMLSHLVKSDQAAIRRFSAEGRTLESLNHPGIVKIHRMIQDDAGRPLAMILDFVSGRRIDLALEDGPLQSEEVVKCRGSAM